MLNSSTKFKLNLGFYFSTGIILILVQNVLKLVY
jgi:hypothetical protein